VDTITVETRGRVGIITLDRPEALNALNARLMAEVVEAATSFDSSRDIGCIVVAGSERAFAAGADIKEMSSLRYQQVYLDGLLTGWDRFAALRTPTIAAVSGYALGGGCELAMMCDFIIAAESAKFGQPEINLGVIPGLGGTQRLTRAVGKARAMELVLTGRTMGASEALTAGLVARVVPTEDLLAQTLETAALIASKSLAALYAAKESVNVAFESTLAEGLRFEKRAFGALFALDDRTEGMAAFIEKREPRFNG
jgi:enoyl-CoA hydratase